MLDIEEFRKIREKLFKNRDKVTNLTDLKNYIQDLEIVSSNEKSEEITNLVKKLVSNFEETADDSSLFKLYWILFRQSFYFIKNMKQTEKLVLKMKEIAERTQSVEHISSFYIIEALFCQIKGNQDSAIKKISKSMEIITNHKDSFREIYYSALYTYTLFLSFKDKHYLKAIKGMKECLEYYYNESNNMSGMIKSIYLLLRFYLLLGKEEEADKLQTWILNQEKIQDRLTDSHYVLLYWYLGLISTIKYQIDEAILYLKKAHVRIIEKNLSHQNMYEYTDTMRLISRCYTLHGDFQSSLDVLSELISFMETGYFKQNYFQRGKKLIYIGSYYTLFFIFAQLDVDIEQIEDPKLLNIYYYIKTLLEESQLARKILIDSSIEENSIRSSLKEESLISHEEVYLTLHNFLSSKTPHTISEIDEEKLSKIRKYTYNPVYMDVFLSKIHLSKGNFSKFKKTAKNIKLHSKTTKEPILQIWSDFFDLILEYISNPDNKSIIKELTLLEQKCNETNFRKIADEINMYKNFLSSTTIQKNLEKQFRRVALMDIFNEESKKLVMESLQK